MQLVTVNVFRGHPPVGYRQTKPHMSIDVKTNRCITLWRFLQILSFYMISMFYATIVSSNSTLCIPWKDKIYSQNDYIHTYIYLCVFSLSSSPFFYYHVFLLCCTNNLYCLKWLRERGRKKRYYLKRTFVRQMFILERLF